MSSQGGQSNIKWIVGTVVVPVILGVPAWLALRDRNEPSPDPVPTAPYVVLTTPPGGRTTSGGDPDFGPASVFLSKLSGPQGTRLSVSGEHFGPQEEIVVSFHTTELARTRASAAGTFTVVVTIPGDYSAFAPKDFSIRANGRTSIKSADAQFRLTG